MNWLSFKVKAGLRYEYFNLIPFFTQGVMNCNCETGGLF